MVFGSSATPEAADALVGRQMLADMAEDG
jgi:hypothetical protein